ncbi:RDD family protein [Streptomyces sp. NPDC051997]|uniref:RDD family protein n=1 Tax=Streptomyces sp. NPDC051997 TaxID=3155611 RepID=UPI00341EC774
MSAPTPAPGDDRPREGYYPDPSIPGYVRYWNGAAWVPGTSRPAPSGGEALAPPAVVRPAQVPAPASSPEFTASRGQTGVPVTEETGPHFFDEDPQPRAAAPAESQHGSRPEPAASWGADRSRQSGFGGDQDRRVSWGAPKGSDPRAADPVSPPDGASASTDGTTTIPPADSGAPRPPSTAGPVVFHRPAGPALSTGPEGAQGTQGAQGASGTGGARGTGLTGEASSGGADAWSGSPGGSVAAAGHSAPGRPAATPAAPDPVPAGGDTALRAPSPRTEQRSGGTGRAGAPGVSAPSAPAPEPGPSPASAARADGRPGTGGPAPSAQAGGPFGTGAPSAQAGGSPATGTPASSASAAQPGGRIGSGTAAPGPSAASSAPAASAGGGSGAGAAAQPSVGTPAPAPVVPQQPGASAPLAAGAGGGQPSWAQQVHQLAGDPAEDGGRVTPWKPPVDDVFQAAARRQAAVRPSGHGRRLAARLVDTVVVAGVTAAAALPLGTRAVDHIDGKIDAARLSGEKVTVWLLDGTTASCLGAVLAVLLVFGVLYEVLPTAKWGRTLGKRLFGIEVRDIEGHEPPDFGRALVRWLVLSVPCLLAVGFVGVLWCLFDKPWSQGWHDKAAHTFVAGPAR